MDLAKLFIPEASVLEMILRGTVAYLFIFLYFRIFRRSAGAIGITDLLLVVLVADAAQSAMSGDEHSITGGLITVATIGFWDYFLDWLAYRFPSLRKLIEAPPLQLIRNGEILHRNMDKEMMTTEDLRAHLRQHDVTGPHEVKAAFMEGDGKLSVVKKDRGQAASPPPDSAHG